MSGNDGEALAIGIDVGGTKIDGVLIDADSADAAIVSERTELTGAGEGTDAVVDRIAGVIRGLLAAAGSRPVRGIGLGCPGQVSASDGVVRAAVNLGWLNVPLRAELAKRLALPQKAVLASHLDTAEAPVVSEASGAPPVAPGAPILLANDVNALALGEYRFGVGRGARSLVYLAVGTGLGGGAVVDGKVIGGDNDFAMEVGHLALRPGGRRCGCGLRGCPEAYTAGIGLMGGVHEYLSDYPGSSLANGGTLTTPMILTAAREGDALALKVIDEAGEMLGIVMGFCAVTLNPDLFVVGGGLGRAAADLLLPRAEKVFRERVLYPSSEKVQIKLAAVERAAIGAASLVM